MHDPASDLAQEWLVRPEQDLRAPVDPGLEQFRALADELTPYTVEFRYPDTLPLVPLEPVRAVVDATERIHALARVRNAMIVHKGP